MCYAWSCKWAIRRVKRVFFFSSRRRHTRLQGDWSSDVCSSDLQQKIAQREAEALKVRETAAIESNLAINRRKTDADREIQIATQDNDIQIASKSKETSEARAVAKAAEALAVSAEEKVTTARAIE